MLDVVPLLAEPLVLACPAGHPLAGEPSIRLDQLIGERFVEAPKGLDFTMHPRSTEALQLVPLEGVRLERRVDLVLPSGHAATPAARRFTQLVKSKVSSP